MAHYYVNDNAQVNGDHEVHVPSCTWFNHINSKTYLGEYTTCHGAVAKAKTIYWQSNGCKTCCPTCHTG